MESELLSPGHCLGVLVQTGRPTRSKVTNVRKELEAGYKPGSAVEKSLGWRWCVPFAASPDSQETGVAPAVYVVSFGPNLVSAHPPFL